MIWQGIKIVISDSDQRYKSDAALTRKEAVKILEVLDKKIEELETLKRESVDIKDALKDIFQSGDIEVSYKSKLSFLDRVKSLFTSKKVITIKAKGNIYNIIAE